MSRYALPLSGYDNYSTWGYDEPMETYFAQLWTNASGGDGDPEIWLSGMDPITSARRLAMMIASRTTARVSDVMRAMAAATSAIESRDLAELAEVARKPATDCGAFQKQ